MKHDLTNATATQRGFCAPFMAIYPGEGLLDAIERHKRATGHVGPLNIFTISDPSVASMGAVPRRLAG